MKNVKSSLYLTLTVGFLFCSQAIFSQQQKKAEEIVSTSEYSVEYDLNFRVINQDFEPVSFDELPSEISALLIPEFILKNQLKSQHNYFRLNTVEYILDIFPVEEEEQNIDEVKPIKIMLK